MRKCTHVMSNHKNKIRLKYFNVLSLNIGKMLYLQLGYKKDNLTKKKLEKTIGSKHSRGALFET
jgi:hypothetical protein